MKLVTFDEGRVGRIVKHGVVEVLDVPDMRVYFERGGAERTGETIPLADVVLRAPIAPRKFIHAGGNWPEHAKEANRDSGMPDLPWMAFLENVDAIIGPDEPVVYPEGLTKELDYEPELCVVVAKAGKFFSASEADRYIGGYVIHNDISARDLQRHEMQCCMMALGKGVDTFCPLGPWIVTPDEVGDPRSLAIELRVNGEVRSQAHTSDMAYAINEILSHFSPLGYSAGDVVSTGAPSGSAFAGEDPASLYLKPGDVVEIEVEKLGVLRNPVVAWRERHDKSVSELGLSGSYGVKSAGSVTLGVR